MLHVTTLTTTEREELLGGAPYRDYAPGEELPIGDIDATDQRRAKGPACWRCGAEERVPGTTLCPDCLPLVLSLHTGESGYAAARTAYLKYQGEAR